MEIDLAGQRDGVAERYVPELMRGRLLEADHIARYKWIAPCASGRRVLDAGCGMAYGSAILAAAGAGQVVGIDIAEAVLEAARPEMPVGVVLETGDLRSLNLADDSFDLVVCLETIEHFADPGAVLDELRRVLAPDGFFAVSSPNKLLSDGLNPHHHHEYTPEELKRELERRFRQVQLVGQRTFVGSVIGSMETPTDLTAVGHASGPPDADDHGSAPFILAVAGDGQLPTLLSVAALGAEMEWQEWIRSWNAQQQALDAETVRGNAAESKLDDLVELRRRLIEAEQLLAQTPERERELRDAIAERDYAIGWARERVADLEARLRPRTYARYVAGSVRRRLL